MTSATISVRLNPLEQSILEQYAKMNGEAVSTAMKRAAIERAEDEFDIRAGEKAYKEWQKGGEKTFTLDELIARVEARK